MFLDRPSAAFEDDRITTREDGRMPRGPTPRPEAERFWEKVEKGGGPKGECWIWMAAAGKPPDEYGRFMCRTDGRWKAVRAHIWAYRTLVGPIPPGMTLDHRVCRVKKCVNPAHLVVCTQGENSSQPDGGAGMRRAKTACLRGHPFDGTNTYVRPNGLRMCRICSLDNKKTAYWQNPDEYNRRQRERRNARRN